MARRTRPVVSRGGLPLLGAWLLMAACGGDMTGDQTPDGGSDSYSVFTDVRTLVPMTPLEKPDDRSPSVPADREALLDDGYGDLSVGPGEAHVTYVPPADDLARGDDLLGEAPAGAREPELLVRFAHLPDMQIVDDESPGRAVNLDNAGALAGAFRPQESYLCHMANAMVRTLNEVHEDSPLSFVLLGGDNVDNAQRNELDWVLKILGGHDHVECDSADDTDLEDGPDNDGKDPFEAPGLDVPFYWVTGNHDVLAQGTAAITPEFEAAVVGDVPEMGFQLRDFSEPGGPVGDGPVPADEGRAFLDRMELMKRVEGDRDGHGLGEEQVTLGKAFYTHDVEGTPIRFVVLDTAAETGGAEGVLHASDIEAFVTPALDEALAEGKWVILTSHHAHRALTDGDGPLGELQEDAVFGDDWLELLGNYPNIVLSLVAHDHFDAVEWLGPAGGHHFWELTSSALADYPHQARIMEVWEHGDHLMFRGTYVDIDVRQDAVAEHGRRLGVMDYVSGWNPFFSDGLTGRRNMEVWVEKPESD